MTDAVLQRPQSWGASRVDAENIKLIVEKIRFSIQSFNPYFHSSYLCSLSSLFDYQPLDNDSANMPPRLNTTLAPAPGPEDSMAAHPLVLGAPIPDGGFRPGVDFAHPPPLSNVPGASQGAPNQAAAPTAATTALAATSAAATSAGASAAAGSGAAAGSAGAPAAGSGAAGSAAASAGAASAGAPAAGSGAASAGAGAGAGAAAARVIPTIWAGRLRADRPDEHAFKGMTSPGRRRRRR
ncbi:hypothetical protein Dda_2173 [Drechslerella dactyloides]|uniref:Uncharacterized protein n=1 Tax=Drechslerella dactyloides TaxID=74499 RepID=A0AAD6NMR7_DREDA|nr:hypothetical protein Dda_2173 [Drechslerella dactyloides]